MAETMLDALNSRTPAQLGLLAAVSAALMFLVATGDTASAPTATLHPAATAVIRAVALADALGAESGRTQFAQARNQADAGVAELATATDGALVALRVALESDAVLNDGLASTLEDLERLPEHRRSPSTGAVATVPLPEYASAIAALFDGCQARLADAGDAAVAGSARTLLALARLRDEAERERAKLAVALISNGLTKPVQQELAALAKSQSDWARLAEETASPATKAALAELRDGKPAGEVARLRKVAADTPQQARSKGAATLWWDAQGNFLAQLDSVVVKAGEDLILATTAADLSGGNGSAGWGILRWLALLLGLAASATLVALAPVPVPPPPPTPREAEVAESQRLREEQVRQLRQQLAEGQVREKDLSRKLENAERRGAELDEALAALESEQKEQQPRLRESEVLRKQIAELETRLAEYDGKALADSALAESQVRALAAAAQRIQDLEESLRTQQGALADEQAARRRTSESTDREKQILQARVTTLDGQLAAAMRQNADLDSARRAAQEAAEAATVQMAEVERAAAQQQARLQQEINTLRVEKVGVDLRVAEAQRAVNAAQAQAREIAAARDAGLARIKDLEGLVSSQLVRTRPVPAAAPVPPPPPPPPRTPPRPSVVAQPQAAPPRAESGERINLADLLRKVEALSPSKSGDASEDPRPPERKPPRE